MTDFIRDRRTNPDDELRERMERWYHRLRTLPADADETTVRDFALAVLYECNAMRDWLLYLPKVLTDRDATDPSRASKSIERPPIPETEIEKLYATQELEICRAIVDGAKHLRLTNTKNPHVDRKIVGDVMSPPRGGPPYPPPLVDLTPAFIINGQPRKARDVCTDCVMRIRGFLRTHGRSTPLMGFDPDTRKGFVVECPEGTPWP